MPEKSKKRQERIEMLLRKYYDLTPEEGLEFEEYCRQDPSLRIIKQRLDNEKLVEEHHSYWEQASTEKRFPVIRQRILAATPQPERRSNKAVRWMVGLASAAALITAIVLVTPLFHPSGSARETAVEEVAGISTDDHPVLLLAEGYNIPLDSLPHGKIWSNQRILITRTDSGHIDYAAAKTTSLTGADRADKITYDTLKVPRGRQFSVTLPDGSMVWLNNASSLRFSPTFSGISRDVYLTGEAYFEVAKNAKSFIVHAIRNGKEYTVKVLGTHFNVSAYPDDPDIRTTLLTGKVLISLGNKTDILHPGEQLIAGKDGSWDLFKDAQARYANAWKRDSIYFEGDLLQVMRQITRWYNVEIEVRNFKRAGEFECILPRGPLPLLLEDLSRNRNVFHFVSRGNKILVTR